MSLVILTKNTKLYTYIYILHIKYNIVSKLLKICKLKLAFLIVVTIRRLAQVFTTQPWKRVVEIPLCLFPLHNRSQKH